MIGKQKGFTEHVISTGSEWVLCIILMIILLTFVSDFKRIKISYPTIHDPFVLGNIYRFWVTKSLRNFS